MAAQQRRNLFQNTGLLTNRATYHYGLLKKVAPAQTIKRFAQLLHLKPQLVHPMLDLRTKPAYFSSVTSRYFFKAD